MHIRELFPDVITEDLDYEFKAVLNSDKPVKWAKTIVAYANGKGGVMFVCADHGIHVQHHTFHGTIAEFDNQFLASLTISTHNLRDGRGNTSSIRLIFPSRTIGLDVPNLDCDTARIKIIRKDKAVGNDITNLRVLVRRASGSAGCIGDRLENS